MSNLEVNVTIDVSDLLKKQETRDELFDCLLSNSEFMNAMANYIATGMTEKRSWAWDVDVLRQKIFAAFNHEEACILMARFNDKDQQCDRLRSDLVAAQSELTVLKHKIESFFDCFRKANWKYMVNSTATIRHIALRHNKPDIDCPACDIIHAVRRHELGYDPLEAF